MSICNPSSLSIPSICLFTYLSTLRHPPYQPVTNLLIYLLLVLLFIRLIVEIGIPIRLPYKIVDKSFPSHHSVSQITTVIHNPTPIDIPIHPPYDQAVRYDKTSSLSSELRCNRTSVFMLLIKFVRFFLI